MRKDGLNISDAPKDFQRPETPPPAPPSAQDEELLCPVCEGSGEGWTMSDSSPDAHMIQVDCGECSGSGSLHGAYQTVKAQRDSLDDRLTTLAGEMFFMRSELESARYVRDALLRDAERYRGLRSRDLDTIGKGGVFAGTTPANLVLNEDTLDKAVDDAMAKESSDG